MQWEKLLEAYEVYLRLERGLAENSIKSYAYDVQNFIEYINKRGVQIEPVTCTKEDLQAYIYLLSKNLNARSQARQISGLKGFFNFLIFEGHRNDSPMDLIETPKIGRKLPEVLSVEEIEHLFRHVESQSDLGKRNLTILETLYGSGLRVSELINLSISNIDFEEQLLLITGKGNKQRLVPLGKICAQRLFHYLREVRPHFQPKAGQQDVVFLNQNGRKLTRAMIFTIVRNAARQADLKKKISPHVFRHSFATHLLENGADLRSIQIMMGHENLTTTEVYMHVDTRHLTKTLYRFHPRN